VVWEGRRGDSPPYPDCSDLNGIDINFYFYCSASLRDELRLENHLISVNAARLSNKFLILLCYKWPRRQHESLGSWSMMRCCFKDCQR
jgi:hypothetical protein